MTPEDTKPEDQRAEESRPTSPQPPRSPEDPTVAADETSPEQPGPGDSEGARPDLLGTDEVERDDPDAEVAGE